MKIQIDTEAKTIKLEGQVSLAEFVEKIKKLFPENAWKDYKLEANTVIQNWTNPIVIREYPIYPYSQNPFWYRQQGPTALATFNSQDSMSKPYLKNECATVLNLELN
jgi:hypothetical protein